jgi:hypothetical protein
MPKEILNDKRLSWRAKGILTYLLGKPNDWTVKTDDVVARAKEGRDAVIAAFGELKACGYAVLTTERRADGKITGRFWTVFDQSQLDRRPENPQPNRRPEKPDDGFSGRHTKNEKSTKNEPPTPFENSELQAAWTEWESHRKHKRQSLTPEAVKRQRAKLTAMGEKRAIAAINFSIEQGYTGIFEPQETNGTHKHNTRENRRTAGTALEGTASRYKGVGQVRGLSDPQRPPVGTDEK